MFVTLLFGGVDRLVGLVTALVGGAKRVIGPEIVVAKAWKTIEEAPWAGNESCPGDKLRHRTRTVIAVKT